VVVNGSGLADGATEGPHHSLLLYWATPGSPWHEETVAGAGTTYSVPSVFVRTLAPAGETDIVAEGPDHTLQYYWATPGRSWSNFQVAGPGTTYSAPSVFVRSVDPAAALAGTGFHRAGRDAARRRSRRQPVRLLGQQGPDAGFRTGSPSPRNRAICRRSSRLRRQCPAWPGRGAGTAVISLTGRTGRL
jgi:hypothetical protein